MMTRCAHNGPNPRARVAAFIVGAVTFIALAIGLPPIVISKGGAILVSALSGCVGVLAYAVIRCAMARSQAARPQVNGDPAVHYPR